MKRGLLVCLLLVLLASSAFGAITFDAVSTQFGANVTTLSWTHTVGAGCTNAILIIDTTWQDAGPGSVSSATYNAVGSTFVAGVTQGPPNLRIEMWRLVAPATGANTVLITYSDIKNAAVAVARSYCGVDQTTPLGTAVTAFGSTTPATVNASSATGELVIDAAYGDANASQTLTVGAGQTQRANLQDPTNYMQGDSEEAGAGTVTMSWTLGENSYWGIVAVPLKPSTAVASPANYYRMMSLN